MTPPSAVLQVLPALASGGVERGTIEIAEAIRDSGFRPIVASAGGALVSELERLGVRHVMLPLATKSPLGLWRNAGSLTALARAEGVRIIHARSRAPAWSALLAARRSGAAFVTTYHGTYNENLPGKRLYNSVMARGDRVIAISGFIADLIRTRHGVPEERIRLIPRGVDPRRFDPALISADAIDAQRAAWDAAPGVPVILLPGRLTRWKGQGVLVAALARLRPPAIAVLAGGGRPGFQAELQAQAAREGVADRLRILGHVPDLAVAMAAADVVVHASTDAEAFGRTVIEAQAMARPVIAADLGGPRETVEQGATGWRVPPGDPDALAKCLAQVLGMSTSAREAVGRAARMAVLARYSTAAMQAATLDVYRELLA
ncbi:glycosyltransferase family 4 protein [Falsiroseomonas selenitidurans]|uniref:Glycosyltransferase family 4 protein n=1 Tax=Falsiroseomonas selenitidurans TaxID=2716335 RepID=A0ABX1E1E4_9PROT|nr:glycosyltransferase family 4 protein [Falsiroseomonas selenitidurans]NKC30926.1 glycosyltransferase family 4 protein [Falsiroseomonas selenitidurans]